MEIPAVFAQHGDGDYLSKFSTWFTIVCYFLYDVKWYMQGFTDTVQNSKEMQCYLIINKLIN